jgi:leucyl aminopeptidase (aminopeptidase T)
VNTADSSGAAAPSHAGSASEPWTPSWDAIADQIVNRTFRLQPGERVVYLADPYLYPEFLDAVRSAVLAAGGVEQATLLTWTPRLIQQRTPRGTAADPQAVQREQHAHWELLQTADVFMWLPNDFHIRGTFTGWETEWILGRWRGRGLHFHWFPDPGSAPDAPINTELQQIYQRAILDLDYAALRDRQRRLVEAIRGRRLRVTTPDGTDLSFSMPRDGWYHCNDGDASREKALGAVCARDREEELPCGAVRSIPAPDSVNGVLSLRREPAWNGFGIDVARFAPHLDIEFRDGRVSQLRAGDRQAELDAAWGALQGDKDRLGEIVIGTNPLLTTPAGARMPTYWGFGDGVFRFHLGDNAESGGQFHSNLWINLFLTDTTITADGETIVRDGACVVA